MMIYIDPKSQISAANEATEMHCFSAVEQSTFTQLLQVVVTYSVVTFVECLVSLSSPPLMQG